MTCERSRLPFEVVPLVASLLLAGCPNAASPDLVTDASSDAATVRDSSNTSDSGTTQDAAIEPDARADGGPDAGALCTPCVANDDCGPNQWCNGGAALGYCAKQCASLVDCPNGWACGSPQLGKAPSPNYCIAPATVCVGDVKRDCTTKWDVDIKPLIATNCSQASCHRHDGQFDSPASVVAVRQFIDLRVMPPTPMTQSERRTILEWMSCGAP